MTFVSSSRSDRENYTYVTKASGLTRDEDGNVTAMTGEELPVEMDHLTEYEDGYVFWSETTYYFTDEDGTEYTFQSEEETTEWMKSHGYTADY
jgi:hypothetical protein